MERIPTTENNSGALIFGFAGAGSSGNSFFKTLLSMGEFREEGNNGAESDATNIQVA